MSPADVTKHIRRQPFVPFRLIVSDGTTYDIRHPELVFVAQTTLIVGDPGSLDGGGPAADYHLLDAFHVVKLIPLGKTTVPSASDSNGPPG